MQYKCKFENCGTIFSEKGDLKLHLLTHKKKRLYICSYNCGKAFATKANKKNHEYRHGGVKPHPCTFQGCTKRYSSMCMLRIHQRTHVIYFFLISRKVKSPTSAKYARQLLMKKETLKLI